MGLPQEALRLELGRGNEAHAVRSDAEALVLLLDEGTVLAHVADAVAHGLEEAAQARVLAIARREEADTAVDDLAHELELMLRRKLAPVLEQSDMRAV